MPDRLLSRSTISVYVFVVLFIACSATGTPGSPAAAAESRPLPSPIPSAAAIAVIDSIVVNCANQDFVNCTKQDSAPASDIELVRAGSSVPEASVKVGTELLNGDKISTKDNDQLVLRVLPREDESDYVLYLDPKSEVSIGSVCLGRGRFLSWVLNTLRVCTDWGILATGGTEFEVNIDTGLDVLAYEGQVTFEPTRITREPEKRAGESLASVTTAAVASSQTASKDKSLKIMSNGEVITSDVSLETRRAGIEYWSGQIIKAYQSPTGVTKGFVNYPDNDRRAEAFKTARLEALTRDSAQGYRDMAQVFNDWDKGAEAEKSLSKVADEQLKESPEFKVNKLEAERLQGKLTEAKIKSVIDKFPDYAPAYYVGGKFFEDKASSDPVNKSKNLEDAKKNFVKALENDGGKSQINRQSVEVDLEKTTKALGTEAVRAEPWLSSGSRWFGTNAAADVVSYRGTVSFDVGGQKTSGEAVLSIIGNQFTLTTGDEIFTGRIVGKRYQSGISFAMQFDDVGTIEGADNNVVISLRGIKLRNGIILQTAPEESGSFIFTSKKAGRVGAALPDSP